MSTSKAEKGQIYECAGAPPRCVYSSPSLPEHLERGIGLGKAEGKGFS